MAIGHFFINLDTVLLYKNNILIGKFSKKRFFPFAPLQSKVLNVQAKIICLFVAGGRYEQIIMPHYYKGRYFSRWLDFRLLIYNAMPNDSGVYSFKAESPNGYSEQQLVYVDSSRKRKRGRLARNRLARNRP